MRLAREFTLLPHGVALVPAPRRQQGIAGATQRTPPGRLTIWPLLLGLVLLSAVPAWAGQPTLPAGVPNIYDPEVGAHFQLLGMANLEDNPDFPVVLLVDPSGKRPGGLIIALDARNGKDTWSLTTDPIILIAVLSDSAAIQDLYVDAGFADAGKPSGSYAKVDQQSLSALPDLLRAVTVAEKQTDF